MATQYSRKSAELSGYDDLAMPIVCKNCMEPFLFQLEDAPPHTARITVDFLKPFFPGRPISKSGVFGCSLRSPNLTDQIFFVRDRPVYFGSSDLLGRAGLDGMIEFSPKQTFLGRS